MKNKYYMMGTLILMGINVVLFLCTDLLMFSPDAAFSFGDISYKTIIYDRQYYRFITSMFLHIDASHIFNNMLTLFVLGSYLEEYLKTPRFLMLYFLSGILAGAASIYYNMLRNYDTPSIGASGAIFGLMGALLYIVAFLGEYRRLDKRRIIFLVLFSLYGGFASGNTDNAAHIGGLASGFLLSIPLVKIGRPPEIEDSGYDEY